MYTSSSRLTCAHLFRLHCGRSPFNRRWRSSVWRSLKAQPFHASRVGVNNLDVEPRRVPQYLAPLGNAPR